MYSINNKKLSTVNDVINLSLQIAAIAVTPLLVRLSVLSQFMVSQARMTPMEAEMTPQSSQPKNKIIHQNTLGQQCKLRDPPVVQHSHAASYSCDQSVFTSHLQQEHLLHQGLLHSSKCSYEDCGHACMAMMLYR